MHIARFNKVQKDMIKLLALKKLNYNQKTTLRIRRNELVLNINKLNPKQKSEANALIFLADKCFSENIESVQKIIRPRNIVKLYLLKAYYMVKFCIMKVIKRG